LSYFPSNLRLGPTCNSAYDVLALPSSEKALISKIKVAAGSRVGRGHSYHQSRLPKNGRVVTGIGDDCAVLRLPAGYDLLTTTDFSLENVHFRRAWHPAESVGHRCLARGLSDIAAMGGEPLAAFLSLAVPAKLPQAWVDGFTRGLLKLAREFEVTLAGGDTAQSPAGILADIVVLGSVPKGKAVLRSRARPGDRIYVTGSLGGSAAALKQLFSKRKLAPKQFPKHFFPQPRISQGLFLRAKNVASSMIDISDGLSTDLNHICEESGFGAEIWAKAIPRATIGKSDEPVDLNFALHGGDDYELLFTARPGRRVPSEVCGVRITCIGEITRGRKISIITETGKRSPLRPGGWQHFRHQ
jgi:thiamine-monophosphate kinase